MGIHEKIGKSDEWFTPKYIFDALNTRFDLDVAHPANIQTAVPAENLIIENSLEKEWVGFVWMNPPWCSIKDKIKWIEKFIEHGNGIALMPDSTSTNWFQYLSKESDLILMLNHRVKFIKPDGTVGDQPANGTTLFAIGERAVTSLKKAEQNGIGICFSRN